MVREKKSRNILERCAKLGLDTRGRPRTSPAELILQPANSSVTTAQTSAGGKPLPELMSTPPFPPPPMVAFGDCFQPCCACV